MRIFRGSCGSMCRFIFLSCFLLLLSNWQNSCEANPFSDLKSIIKYSKKLFSVVSAGVKGAQMVQTEQKLTGGEADIENKISELSTDFQIIGTAILDKISKTLQSKLSAKTDKFFKYMKNVEYLYQEFLRIFYNLDKVPHQELVKFAKLATSSSLVESKSSINKMHDIFVHLDLDQDSIISIIARNSSAADTVCKRLQSSHQLIYDLYDMVSKTHMKGLMVILFGYGVLQEHYGNETNYDWMKQNEIDQYVHRMKETHNKVKYAMSVASRELWRCDPPNHILYNTYSKLGEIFQAYVLYQADTYRSKMSALTDSCADLKNEVLKCYTPRCLDQPKERRCRGAIRDCEFIDKGMKLCHASYGSSRRYDWMKTDSGIVYGHNEDSCKQTQNVGTILTADTCVCNCESEDRWKARYFSLFHTTSDIEANKVVTGVRIVERDFVFYLEIQEGTLGPDGTIQGSPIWKQTEQLPIPTLLSNEVSIPHHDDKWSFWDDYHDKEYNYHDWIDWRENPYVYSVNYEQRTVYLDDIRAPLDKLVTGLRFKRSGDDLKLEVRVTGFDYSTGQLDVESTSWLSSSNSKSYRSGLNLQEPDEPIRAPVSDEVSSPNTYVKFRMSDLKKDFGQSTIPYIDLQEIETNPPGPVTGVGLFHRGKRNYGGFLSLKLIQYDFTPHM